MATKSEKRTAPYATFSSLINFINKLKEVGIPSRVDPSAFGNASGSISYSIIATLKILKLINSDGIPNAAFKEIVEADEANRKALMKKIIRDGYPTLWDGTLDLKTVTASQFDEHLREQYESKGSTIDKAAAFFISAANFTDEPISTYLKNRKPTYSSISSKKSAKERKRVDGDVEDEGGQNTRLPPERSSRPLEYQLIDLMREPDIADEIKQSIWNLVQYLTNRNK
jgi:hypothetical protein